MSLQFSQPVLLYYKLYVNIIFYYKLCKLFLEFLLYGNMLLMKQ